jgi:hypothetical protein
MITKANIFQIPSSNNTDLRSTSLPPLHITIRVHP